MVKRQTTACELTGKLIKLMEQRSLHELNKTLRTLLLEYLNLKLPEGAFMWFIESMPTLVELFEIIDMAGRDASRWN